MHDIFKQKRNKTSLSESVRTTTQISWVNRKKAAHCHLHYHYSPLDMITI